MPPSQTDVRRQIVGIYYPQRPHKRVIRTTKHKGFRTMATYYTISLIKHLQPETIKKIFAPISRLLEQPSSEFQKVEFHHLLEDIDELGRRWHICLSTDHAPKETGLISKIHDTLQSFQTIHDSSCDGVQIAKRLSESDESMELDEDFGKWNRYEQAAYIFFSNKRFWDKWSNLVIISDCSRKKTCIKYPNLPLKTPTQKKSDLKAMVKITVDFFRPIKGSRSSVVQTYRLGPNYHYFATLQEKPIVLEIDNPEKDMFEATRVILPYRFVFSFNEEEGVFSLYGVDGVSDCNTLAALLLKVLIGYNGELMREPKPIYNLSPLKDRSFLFDIDGSDGIEEVVFKSVTVRPIDDPKSQITFSNGEDGVFHCIDRYLDEKELKLENIEFVRAVVLFRMRPEFTAFRQATFELSLTGDNLSEKTDAQAKLLRKYIRRWRLRLAGEQLSTTLIMELIKFSSGEKPIMSYQYREMLPSAVRYGLMEWGFLKRTQNAASIQIGDSAFKVEYFRKASGDDLAPVVIGQNGDIEDIEDEDIERYLVDYSALAALLHDELECRGQTRMELNNKVWWLGNKGQEGRNIYFVRNWHGFQDVRDFLRGVKDSSLVIYIGDKPEQIRIGNRSSEIPGVASDLQNQYYDVNGLVEYSDTQGFFVSAEPIWENLKTMFARRPVKRRVKTPGKQEQIQETVERYVWQHGITLVDLIKRYIDGDDLNETETKCLTAVFGYTNRDFCKKVSIEDYQLSRVKDKWDDEKECPFGVIYKELFNILIPPQKDRCNLLDAREERVTFLHNYYPELLRKLRDVR